MPQVKILFAFFAFLLTAQHAPKVKWDFFFVTEEVLYFSCLEPFKAWRLRLAITSFEERTRERKRETERVRETERDRKSERDRERKRG